MRFVSWLGSNGPTISGRDGFLGVRSGPSSQGAEEILQSLVGTLVRDWPLPDGHFVTGQTVAGRDTVRYHRWARAQAFQALVRYVADERAR